MPPRRPGRWCDGGVAPRGVIARWPEGPEQPRLGPSDVHVWSMELPVAVEGATRLACCLSEDERARAARFASPLDRARFAVGRGLLRTILARYTGTEPSAIRLCTNRYGKPSLESRAVVSRALEFNFSRSDGIALCALARGRMLGVDVELERESPDLLEIAERFFSVREREMLRALPADQRCRAFYLCWSRKEAYIKARGLGMSLALDSFDVSLAPDQPAELLAERGEPRPCSAWTLHHLEPAHGYAAALVVEREGSGGGGESCGAPEGLPRVSCYHSPLGMIDPNSRRRPHEPRQMPP